MYNLPCYCPSIFQPLTHATRSYICMTSQVTNRREGGSTSCRSCCRKLRYICIYIYVIYNLYINVLLGALTIGRGECPARGSKEGVKEVKKTSMPPGIYKNGQFPALIDLKNAKNAIFLLKST
jgi:hypothetical protein